MSRQIADKLLVWLKTIKQTKQTNGNKSRRHNVTLERLANIGIKYVSNCKHENGQRNENVIIRIFIFFTLVLSLLLCTRYFLCTYDRK
jgi:hypothetical protein